MPDPRVPGPLGAGGPAAVPADGTLCLAPTPAPGPVCAVPQEANYTEAEVLLAATAYGESSEKDVFEEMAAIANVIVRQAGARGAEVAAFLRSNETFAFAAHDGNPRFKQLSGATPQARQAHAGMRMALQAARNALSGGADHSNGAWFWDGRDLKTNVVRHPKVAQGIVFSDKSHDIFGLGDRKLAAPKVVHWLTAQGAQGKERGRYDHAYESTAAYGDTVFWKYGADFLKATGNRAYD